MAETIFAGKKIKELSSQQGFPGQALPGAIIPGFPENLFMGNCPCHTGNGYCQYK
jgi:hypothetical protein